MKGIILNEFLCDCFSDADILIKLERSSPRRSSVELIDADREVQVRCACDAGGVRERGRVEVSLAEAENSGEQRKGRVRLFSTVLHWRRLGPQY